MAPHLRLRRDRVDKSGRVTDAIRDGDGSAKMSELTAAIERFVKG